MKHASIRELFEYWNERRGRRRRPTERDIEPGAIRRVLADTFILAFDAAAGHPFRIAGTRVCAAFGRELKSEAFVGSVGAGEHGAGSRSPRGRRARIDRRGRRARSGGPTRKRRRSTSN